MAQIASFTDLEIWKLATAFAVDVYNVSGSFPDSERYGLTSQLRRASVSVSSNIAEGWGIGRSDAQLHFVRIARGSLYECHSLLVIGRRLGFITDDEAEFARQIETLGRKLNAYLSAVGGFVREDDAEYEPTSFQLPTTNN